MAVQQLGQRLTDFQLKAGDEVDTLFSCIHHIKVVIGSIPSGLVSEDGNTIWEMFAILHGLSLELDVIPALDAHISHPHSQSEHTHQRLISLTESTNEMVELVQLLHMEQAHHNPSTTGGHLSQDIASIITRLEHLESQALLTSSSELSTVKAQLKLLEACMPANTFFIGGKTLNSKADVALFVEKEMPGISYSLFHDIFTLLESISDGQSKKETIMAVMYKAG